jgi:hypothetical protein
MTSVISRCASARPRCVGVRAAADDFRIRRRGGRNPPKPPRPVPRCGCRSNERRARSAKVSGGSIPVAAPAEFAEKTSTFRHGRHLVPRFLPQPGRNVGPPRPEPQRPDAWTWRSSRVTRDRPGTEWRSWVMAADASLLQLRRAQGQVRRSRSCSRHQSRPSTCRRGPARVDDA